MSGNTYRGTPTRNQGRGAVPFTNSPSGGSSIPRPVLEPSPPTETGSAVSASRQKQSKRDEVRHDIPLRLPSTAIYTSKGFELQYVRLLTFTSGHPKEARK
jgi:hypothetical protein